MPLLGETVQSSREKRLERQQARLRDRGGIFKPSEHNPLLDILLARGVNGESPSRVNSPRRSRSRSASPSRKGQSVPSPKHKSRTTHSKSDRRISTVERIPQKSAKLDNSHIQGLSEDLIPSSSKSVTSKFSLNGRPVRSRAKDRRSKTQISHRQPNQMHEDINIEPTDREPGKSERPAEDRSTQQTTVSARASGLQRTAKRNAPFLEADQEQDADGHAPGDDEQFLQPKGTKSSVRSESSVKSPSREKRLLITHASDEADVTSPEHARRQRSKRKREKHPPGSKKTFNEAHVTPRAASRHDLRETKCEHRGRRKAASTTSDVGVARTRAATTPPVMKTRNTKRTVAPASANSGQSGTVTSTDPWQHSADEANEPTFLQKAHPVRNTKGKLPKESLDHADAVTQDDDDQCPVPQYSEPNEPSSPDVPLARLQTSSGKQRAAKALVAKRSKDTVHHIEDDTFLPPRKKVKPLEGERCAPAHNDRKERRPAKHLPPLGSPESEAVRRRAPPVLVSKGTVLKPKPRPRLSLFPVPSLDEDSERDPIDFLS